MKERTELLAFYDFPAEHWKHLRSTNPIESTFATVRHRTIRSKGCLSNKTALAMVFKLADAAQKSWRRLDGHVHLPKVILGVKFVDGIEVVINPTARLKPKLPPEPSGRHQLSAIARRAHSAIGVRWSSGPGLGVDIAGWLRGPGGRRGLALGPQINANRD